MRLLRGLSKESGMTLIEVTIVVAILATAVMGMQLALIGCARVNRQSQEQDLALVALRRKMEELRGVAKQNLNDVITSYNADPSDDPGGPGTAPGSTFAVPGLNLRPGSATVGQVNVDASNPDLLDVGVLLNWRGVAGDQDLSMWILLASY